MSKPSRKHEPARQATAMTRRSTARAWIAEAGMTRAIRRA